MVVIGAKGIPDEQAADSPFFVKQSLIASVESRSLS